MNECKRNNAHTFLLEPKIPHRSIITIPSKRRLRALIIINKSPRPRPFSRRPDIANAACKLAVNESRKGC